MREGPPTRSEHLRLFAMRELFRDVLPGGEWPDSGMRHRALEFLRLCEDATAAEHKRRADAAKRGRQTTKGGAA